MKERKRKNMSLCRLQALAVILGFTLVFFAAGCAAARLAELFGGSAEDLAGWSGVFGMIGFFAGVVFLMRSDFSE